MLAYKKFKASDVGLVPTEAHKEYTFTEGNIEALGIAFYDSLYTSESSENFEIIDEQHHKKHFQLEHLFYKDAPTNYGSLIGDINYVNQEKRLYKKANIVSISQKNTGNGIQKGTFKLGSYVDDKKGNLIESSIYSSGKYPTDKDRVFHLGPVNGYKYVDLSVNPQTRQKIANAPEYLHKRVFKDDSIYTNTIIYNSCSIYEYDSGNLNGFTAINVEDGYVKVAHNEAFNFNDEDFTISFWLAEGGSNGQYIFSKSYTKTVAGTPTFPSSQNSGSFEFQEVDAGLSTPFEIFIQGGVTLRRKDENTSVEIGAGTGTGHFTFVKEGNTLKSYKNGVLIRTETDPTVSCGNQADIFIGNRGGSRAPASTQLAGKVSQLSIFSRALDATEVDNIYDFKNGSPVVGNVFYEPGIAVITRPDAALAGFTSLDPQTVSFLIEPTGLTGGSLVDIEVTSASFSGSFTFFNQETNPTPLPTNNTELIDALIYDESRVSASINAGVMRLSSYSDIISPDYPNPFYLNPIFSSSTEFNFELTEYSELENSMSFGVNTTSTVTDDYLILDIVNQTVTESFTIEPDDEIKFRENLVNDPGQVAITNGTELEDYNTDESEGSTNISGQYWQVPSEIEIAQVFNRVASGSVLTTNSDSLLRRGEIVITGSKGFCPPVTNLGTVSAVAGTANSKKPFFTRQFSQQFGNEVDNPSNTEYHQNTGPIYVRIGGSFSANGGPTTAFQNGVGSFGIGNLNDGGIYPSNTFNLNGLDIFPDPYTNSDVLTFNSSNGVIVQEAYKGGKYNDLLYVCPGNLTFEYSAAYGLIPGGVSGAPTPTTTIIDLQVSYDEGTTFSTLESQQSNPPISGFINFFGTTTITEETIIAKGESSGWPLNIKFRFRIRNAFNSTNAIYAYLSNNGCYVALVDQEVPAGFKDYINFRTTDFSVDDNSYLTYKVEDARSGTDMISLGADDDEFSMGTGSLDNSLTTNSEIMDSDKYFTDARLALQLCRSQGGNTNVVQTTIISGDRDDYENIIYQVPNGDGGNYFLRFISIGPTTEQQAYINAYKGFHFGFTALEEFKSQNVFDLSSGESFTISGSTQAISDSNVLNSSISITFDDDSDIIIGNVPDTFVSNTNGNQIQFVPQSNEDDFTIIEPLGVTASMDIASTLSASFSHSFDTPGLYELDDLTIQVQSNLPGRVEVKTIVDDVLYRTSYIDPGTAQNIFNAQPGKIGYQSNELLKYEFTVVDNNDDPLRYLAATNDRVAISNLNCTFITSSDIITKFNGELFPSIGGNQILKFDSPHDNVGEASFPFDISGITASINDSYVASPPFTNIQLTKDYLITASFEVAGNQTTIYDKGPFIISASLPIPVPYEKHHNIDGSFSSIRNIREPIIIPNGIGAGIRVYGGGGVENGDLLYEKFTDQHLLDGFISPATGYFKIADNTSTGQTASMLFFISGADGAMTAGSSPSGSPDSIEFNLISLSDIMRSGSYFSNETITQAEFGDAQVLRLTSSHTDVGPVFTLDPKFNVGQISPNRNIQFSNSKIRILDGDPLYITASSEATGTYQTLTEAVVNQNPTSINPVITLDTNIDINNVIGGTFTYDGEEYLITNITDNPNGAGLAIYLDNLDNGSDVIQVGDADSQTPSEITVNYNESSNANFPTPFKLRNTHLIFENEFHCTIEEGEFNATLNPTARKYKTINKSELADFATGSNFQPYVTTIGLYNEDNELLVVGKLAQPVKTSNETDTTFVVRYDI